MSSDLRDHILWTKSLFVNLGRDHAVVGFSGGIDSTVTALLLRAAGIDTTLVVADAPNQKYSSPMGGFHGAVEMVMRYPGLSLRHEHFEYPFSDPVENEAALPILRVAVFYGVAAKLRAQGKKPVVVGTVNMSEAAYLGFWGKASDAAQDFYPISHWTKSEVYEFARELDAPEKIIAAVPSGDLLFENTNDRKMIGAGYDLVDEIIRYGESTRYSESTRPPSPNGDKADKIKEIARLIWTADDPGLFADNIIRNAFKYMKPLPGFHCSARLELFRNDFYQLIFRAAWEVKEKL